MSGSNDSDRMLGLSPSDERILLYGILCPSTDGSRNAIDYMKLASVLGYTPSSAKVMYGNARRKLARFTGMEVPIIARGNIARGTAAAGSKTTASGDSKTTTDAPETDESPAKKPRKTPPTTSRKRKADKLETTQTEEVVETKTQTETTTQAQTETQAETKIEAKAKTEIEAKAETDVEVEVNIVPEHKEENGEAEEEVVKTETEPSEAKEKQS
ncbi:Uncharacterized protein PECH_000551 [Penicillium ucsense]|uniref:Uncharacterized protein n=1 Tax=Penicillium ucsense TaxID=2839758 RepID=A0A8J8WHW4_9EURO|nr:Uncharacterized protein PECM_000924 [Penicillium ucsense]KAF7733452.1 Uncharacterized protein PECH_000551 [Penicillium ucsense]